MDSGFMSGGVIIVVAAALWLVYLVPSWVRDSQFSASERNAIRLQQTLRVLAETSEVPETVRVEATAREVAAHRKVLKQVEANSIAAADAAAREELANAERERSEAEERAARAEIAARAAEAAARAAQRNARAARMARSRRRARLMATSVLIASIVGLAFGTSTLIAGGGFVLLAASAGVAMLAFTALGRMSRVMHRATVPIPAVQVTTRPVEPAMFEYSEPVAAATQSLAQVWTPTPIPKPLYLSEGSSAASELAKADAYAQLRRAAMQEAMASRAEQLRPEVPKLAPRRQEVAEQATEVVEPVASASVQAPSVPSRFASMGIVDDGEIEASGNTLVQRRRAAG